MTDRRDPTPHVEVLRAHSDEEDLLDPISTHRRRTIIRYLARLSPDTTVSTEELARVCAAVELDEPVDTLAYSDYRRPIDALRQRDLMRLSMDGVLDTRDREAVGRSEDFENYAAVLNAIDEWLE